MKYGIMEGFQMFDTKISYGLVLDRISILKKAKKLGFDGIEFGVDVDYQNDPLWTGKGNQRQTMKEAAQKTGVEAASICLHLLNYKERSPASDNVAHRREAKEIIQKSISACAEIGASVILMPFFGSATLRSKEQIQCLIHEMKEYAPIAEDKKVTLGLETSLSAQNMTRIVEAIGSDYVLVYFDTGNAIEIGYDVIEEIEGLGKYIAQVHIKDSPSDEMLGRGRIDFKAVIETLKKVGFDGYLMLETQSTEDSIAAAYENLAYLKKCVG